MSVQTNEITSYLEQKDEMVKHMAGALPPAIKATFDRDANELTVNHPNPLKLKKGDKAVGFELPNALGETIKLADLLMQGPVVLIFYRGTWCPFCNLELKNYQKVLPLIKEQGANLVAISGQVPDQSLSMKEKNELEFEVLSDANQKVAAQYTTIFKNADAALEVMKDLGLDFHSFYSDDSANLPVPAVYIIAQDGTIAFAGSKGGDYRERTEPAEVLQALSEL